MNAIYSMIATLLLVVLIDSEEVVYDGRYGRYERCGTCEDWCQRIKNQKYISCDVNSRCYCGEALVQEVKDESWDKCKACPAWCQKKNQKHLGCKDGWECICGASLDTQSSNIVNANQGTSNSATYQVNWVNYGCDQSRCDNFCIERKHPIGGCNGNECRCGSKVVNQEVIKTEYTYHSNPNY